MEQTPYYYIKAPLQAVKDTGLPDPIFRTLCRLLATAREFRYQRTPQMTIHEMAQAAGLKERAMWNHLSALRESVHVSVESPRRGHYVLHFAAFQYPEDLSAQLCSSPVVVEISPDLDHQQHSSDLGGGVGGESLSAQPCTENPVSAQVCTETPDPFTLRALAEIGILEPTRSELAAKPWVTRSYVNLWHLWLAVHPEAGPGVVIQNMRQAVDAPEVDLAELEAIEESAGLPGVARDCLQQRRLQRYDELGIKY
jgi:hypothetical protein